MKSRIYGENIAIDSSRVNGFFEQRFCKENPLASVMVRSGPDDAVAEKRNANESVLVNGFLRGRDGLRVLDLGCGTGRWAGNIKNRIAFYAGLDFTENYIKAAKEIYADRPEFVFVHSPVTAPDPDLISRRYDLVIINGLCVYLNDEDVSAVAGYIEGLLEPGGLVYFRESVSVIGERITLRNYYSEELQCDYNAIYRTPAEYEAVFGNLLPGCRVRESGFLLDESTGARPETNQKYWLLQKSG